MNNFRLWPTFEKVITELGLSAYDCHKEIPRNDEYRALGHGAGAICIEEAVTLGGLLMIHKPDIVIELGTAWGASSVAMASVLKDLGKGHLYTVDLAKDMPFTSALAERHSLPLTYITKTRGRDFLTNLAIKPNLRYFVFSDTDIPQRPGEVKEVIRRFPKGSLVAVHDTSDLHPIGPMNLPKHVTEREIIELPSPRGLSILKV